MLTERVATAGETIEVTRRQHLRHTPGRARAPRGKPTKEAQLKINKENQNEKARLLVNTNFGEGDVHASYTYDPKLGELPTDRERVVLDAGNLHDRLKRFFKKQGVTYKYFAVCEVGKKGKWHIHIIMPYIRRADAERIWGKGTVKISELDGTGDYKDLVEYLLKKTDWEFEHKEELRGKRRYSTSRNLKKPTITVKQLRRRQFSLNPKPYKGYRILPESVYVGKNPYNGSDYLFYRMLRI